MATMLVASGNLGGEYKGQAGHARSLPGSARVKGEVVCVARERRPRDHVW